MDIRFDNWVAAAPAIDPAPSTILSPSLTTWW
jgi:hypothetical protein